jgi:hypothetical protein
MFPESLTIKQGFWHICPSVCEWFFMRIGPFFLLGDLAYAPCHLNSVLTSPIMRSFPAWELSALAGTLRFIFNNRMAKPAATSIEIEAGKGFAAT